MAHLRGGTRTALISGALALVLCSAASAEPRRNGFDLASSSVPVYEILNGGPPRDGIPALTLPPLVSAAEAPWQDDDRVIGITLDGESRAYPIAMLDWHELVNDRLGSRHILVSYCPLCGTGMVFDREIGGRIRIFGVSGLLYQSDVLLYDRRSESLWSQIASEAITGPERGKRLELLRSAQIPWGEWRERHPDTTALSALDTVATTARRRTPATRPPRDCYSPLRSTPATPRRPRHWACAPRMGLRARIRLPSSPPAGAESWRASRVGASRSRTTRSVERSRWTHLPRLK